MGSPSRLYFPLILFVVSTARAVGPPYPVLNPFTGSAYYIPGTTISSSTLPSGSTQYIQNTLAPTTTTQAASLAQVRITSNTILSGATFYQNGPINIYGPMNIAGASPTSQPMVQIGGPITSSTTFGLTVSAPSGQGGNIGFQTTANTQYMGFNGFNSNGTLAASFQFGDSAVGSYPNAIFMGNRLAGQPMYVIEGPGGSDVVATFQNDNLGIGGGSTFTPGAPLTIKYTGGLTNVPIGVSNFSDQDFNVFITSPSAVNKYALLAPSVNTKLELGVNQAAEAYITSTGMGIGTPPSHTFDVAGNAAIGATTSNALLLNYGILLDGGNLVGGTAGAGVNFLSAGNNFGLDYLFVNAMDSGAGIAVQYNPNGTPNLPYDFQFATDPTGISSLLLVGARSGVGNLATQPAHYIAVSNDLSAGAPWPLIFDVAPNNTNWGTAGYAALTIKPGTVSNTMTLSPTGVALGYGITAATGTFTTSVTAGTSGAGTQLYRCSGGADAGWILYGNSGAAQTLCTTGGGSLVAISYFAP